MGLGVGNPSVEFGFCNFTNGGGTWHPTILGLGFGHLQIVIKILQSTYWGGAWQSTNGARGLGIHNLAWCLAIYRLASGFGNLRTGLGFGSL